MLQQGPSPEREVVLGVDGEGKRYHRLLVSDLQLRVAYDEYSSTVDLRRVVARQVLSGVEIGFSCTFAAMVEALERPSYERDEPVREA